jgi:CRISPR-associated protein Csd2
MALFWQSLEKMFELDRSASRGQMAPQALIVFEHSEALGNAPAHQLQQRVTVSRVRPDEPPRSFGDYTLCVNEDELPSGIAIDRKF